MKRNTNNEIEPPRKRVQCGVSIDDDIKLFMYTLNVWTETDYKNKSEVNLRDFIQVYGELNNFNDLNKNFINHKDLEVNNEMIAKINTIVEKLDEIYHDKVEEYYRIWDKMKCTYGDLSKYYYIGGEYIININDEPICGVVIEKKDCNGIFRYYSVIFQYQYYSTIDKNYAHKTYEITYPYTNDTYDVSNFKIMTEEMKIKLQSRGEKYAKYCTSYHHVNYNGYIYNRVWYGYQKLLTCGRIMIDNEYYNKSEFSNNEKRKDIQYYQLEPFLGCYDLTTHRKWGLCSVEHVTDINHNDNAFDCLNINKEFHLNNMKEISLKNFIRDLVKNKHKVDFNDIIQGKSCGMIFLLYGPPGVGKTLMAESTAEVLHIPLYYLTAGELGDNPHTLENNLNKTLELSKRWNSIILIDEADVFLERRNDNITKNAIVSIFLKLLESYNGIIFLTSNKIQNIDSAILSRLSLAVEFKNLTNADQYEIWTKQLEIAKINNIDINKLSGYNLNGRQIKNIIKLSQCAAIGQNAECTTELMESICIYFNKHHNPS